MFYNFFQLEARKKGEKMIVSKGATVSLEPHEFGWRDAMDIVVKWRQFSEPNDQVYQNAATVRKFLPRLAEILATELASAIAAVTLARHCC